jgi:DNA-binding MarR family transcriptional regulator
MMKASEVSSLLDIAISIKEGKILPDMAFNLILASFPSIDEAQARKIVGLPTTTMSSCDHKHEFSSDDIQIFSEYGLNADEYKVIKSEIIEWDTPSDEVFQREEMMFATVGELNLALTDLDKSILSMLSNGEDSTAIAEATGVKIEDIAKTIQKITELGIYGERGVSDLGKQLIEEKPAPVDRFMVVYSYQERPGVPPVITKSRDFCLRLLGLNRLYTRDDINSISSRVDRDVWKYRGGWYTNPETGATTPYCRHIWVQQLVIKK